MAKKRTACGPVMRLTAGVLGAAVALVFCLGALKTLPVPFIWIYGAAIVYCAAVCALARHDGLRNVFLVAIFVFFPLAMVEAGLWATTPTAQHTVFSPADSAYTQSRYLGYAPRANTRIKARETHGDAELYDVTYSIKPNGLRSTGQSGSGSGPEACIVLFGGSFTFGQGLDDAQSLPAMLAARLGKRYRVVNFAYMGYGAHQMLSALAHHIVQKRADCDVEHIVYIGLVEHVGRVAGLAPWDTHGPRYRLGGDGRARYTGTFDSGLWSSLWLKTRKQLQKSMLYARLFSTRLAGPYSDREIALYAAVVARARSEAGKAFPQADFNMLMWDSALHRAWPIPQQPTVLQALKQHGIQPTMIDKKVLPGPASQYHVSRYDEHPNARANARTRDLLISRWGLNRVAVSADQP